MKRIEQGLCSFARMKSAIRFFFMLLAGFFSASAQGHSVEEILNANVEWKGEWMNGSNNSISDSLVLAYAGTQPENAKKGVSFHRHFNKAFFVWLTRNAPGFNRNEVLASTLQLYLNTGAPVYLEMAGDLILKWNDTPELPYLAALAYWRAGEKSKDEQVKKDWQRKAVFAMENPILGPGQFDKIREYRFREAVRAEEYENPTLPESGEIQFWPDTKSPFFTFAQEQVKIDLEKNRKTVVSRDITLPGVDPKEVKRNVKYNLYAIFVLLALFTTIGIMIFKFRKAARQLDEEEEGLR